jgi:exopolysaccharide biosynthesis polyprenyl glycosylphosphotransferase
VPTQLQRVPTHVDKTGAMGASLPAADSARWLRRYIHSLVLTDAAALIFAGLIAVWVRFRASDTAIHGLSYYSVALLLGMAWLAVLALSRCYEARFVGSGSEEYKRIANASVRVVAVVALVSYAFKLDVARGFVAVVLPLGLAMLLVGRYTLRMLLYRARRAGRCSHRVLVVGAPNHVEHLVRQLRREPLAGLQVVGACLSGRGGTVVVDGFEVPVVGTLSTIADAMAGVQADTVAVAASPGINAEALRRLSYELEGTGVDLLVAPALTNVTGTRISIRPVAGLPLLHVDEPELSGGRKLLKGLFDRTTASILLVLLLPLLVGIAIVVRTSSRGPVIFRQLRVGRDRETFCVWKFRSMYADAEHRRAALETLNEHDGVLFKIRNDPRITPVGQFLRKYSLDELPQLVNVLRGQMSLVGPRPPLPSEVEQYEGHTHRRLLVKPGITGLWQVSGRSNLSWEDTVRLDLQYVENWSLGLDLMVLAKTVLTVVRGSGAY